MCGRQMRHVGVEHHQLGERVVLQLGAEVQARGARQVVEAVAVLQVLELGLEHEVEGRAQHAAERHLLLGQAADPEVDVVETGGGHAVAGPWRVQHVGRPVLARQPVLSQEVEPVRPASYRSPPNTSSERRGALVRQRGRAGDERSACRRRR